MSCKKLASSLVIMLAFTINTKAQAKLDTIRHHKNAVYLELGGPTLIYSLGYERTWYKNKWFAAVTSVGFSYIPDGITMGYVEPGVLFRDKNVAFEMGIALISYRENSHSGTQFATSDGSGSAKMLTISPRIGVRFFTKNQRFHFRTGITPSLEIWNNDPQGWPKDNRNFFWLNVFTFGYRF